MSSNHPLPKGANGLDLGGLVLALARDKLIFTPKGAREHYTLHLGPNSRVIDVHKILDRPTLRLKQLEGYRHGITFYESPKLGGTLKSLSST